MPPLIQTWGCLEMCTSTYNSWRDSKVSQKLKKGLETFILYVEVNQFFKKHIQ